MIAQREFRREFGIHRNRTVPSAHAIKTWVRNFEAAGSTLKKKGSSVKTVRTSDNIAVVREATERTPHRSARRLSVSLGLSEASVWRILQKDLHVYTYKIQVPHALHERDDVNRVNLCQTFLQLSNRNQELVNSLLMSDKAHFLLSGFVNKQNFRYWFATNPIELQERPVHSSKVSMARDIFIWNYRSLLLWRWDRKGCNCDWTTLRSHVGELLRSWAWSSSSNRSNVFPTSWSYEPRRTRFHSSCEEFFS